MLLRACAGSGARHVRALLLQNPTRQKQPHTTHLADERLADRAHELVRRAKDEHVGVAHGALQVGVGDDVGAERHAREVFGVFVALVDDVGQLAALVVLFKHPHAHLVDKLGRRVGGRAVVGRERQRRARPFLKGFFWFWLFWLLWLCCV